MSAKALSSMLMSGLYASSGASIFGGGSTKVSSASSFDTSDFITPTLPMALSLTYFVNEATFFCCAWYFSKSSSVCSAITRL